MSNKELNELSLIISKKSEKAISSKKKNRQLLYVIGILDKNGNVTESYKDLCIPIGQA
jgi:hypothetical protein